MAHRPARNKQLEALPPLPYSAAQWQLLVRNMELSGQQAEVVEWILRGACRKQIATAMGIEQTTIKSYLDRVFARTGTRDCMQLAMHTIALLLRLLSERGAVPRDDTQGTSAKCRLLADEIVG
jgi:DNA-binding NarL/FixJ family response regulator